MGRRREKYHRIYIYIYLCKCVCVRIINIYIKAPRNAFHHHRSPKIIAGRACAGHKKARCLSPVLIMSRRVNHERRRRTADVLSSPRGLRSVQPFDLCIMHTYTTYIILYIQSVCTIIIPKCNFSMGKIWVGGAVCRNIVLVNV